MFTFILIRLVKNIHFNTRRNDILMADPNLPTLSFVNDLPKWISYKENWGDICGTSLS